jgi:hypothetical protein
MGIAEPVIGRRVAQTRWLHPSAVARLKPPLPRSVEPLDLTLASQGRGGRWRF